jgi:LytS/YehU family sensor histidine kinase
VIHYFFTITVYTWFFGAPCDLSEKENFNVLIITIMITFTINTIYTASSFYEFWMHSVKEKEDLVRESSSAEFETLKNQINPHFLFNSLNNLYALTLSKSDLAPEVVLRLSNILRYILYESNQGKVSVRKEMEHVKDYVLIEKLRIGDTVKIDLEIEDKLNDELVEPMLFLTLVENAFKHSEQVLPDQRFIRIHAHRVEHGFRFLIENSFNPEYKSLERGGIGLQNIKKRLTLIYPNKHDIKSSISDGVYRVDLVIQLN